MLKMRSTARLFLAHHRGAAGKAVPDLARASTGTAKKAVRSVFADPARSPLPVPGADIPGKEGARQERLQEGRHEGSDPFSMKGSRFTAGSAIGKGGIPPIQRDVKTDPTTGEALEPRQQETLKGANEAEQQSAWRMARAEKGQKWAQANSPKRKPE